MNDTDNTLQIKLTQKQSKGWQLLENEDLTELLFDGGVRAGKSFIIILYLLKFALTVPGVWILIGRRFFEHARKSLYLQTIEPLLARIPQGLYNVNKQDWVIRFYNNSQMWLSGFDDSQHINAIMGREYLMTFLNEATEINEEMVDKVKTRLAQKIENNKGGYHKPRLFFDCNPVAPEFYLNKRFEQGRISADRLHWTVYDNRKNLTQDYLTDLENSLGDLEKDRLIHGLWVGSGDYVYKRITEDVIVDSYNRQSFTHFISGIDWGYISAFSLWGISDRQATCMAEVESKGKITSEFLEEIENKITEVGIKKDEFTIFADHELDRIEEAKRKGFKIKPAYKDVAAGDSTVNWFDVKIFKDCPNVYRSMKFLQNSKDRNGIIIEGKHDKIDDHGADAARYALHSYRMEYEGKNDKVLSATISYSTEDCMKWAGI